MARKDWTWLAWPKRSGGLEHDPDHPADADLVGSRSGGFQEGNRRPCASVPATSQNRPDGRCFGGFFESAAQGIEVPRIRWPRVLVVSKKALGRKIFVVAVRCETTDLRAGRPSTPIAALECQARQRPGSAAVAAYYACGLMHVGSLAGLGEVSSGPPSFSGGG